MGVYVNICAILVYFKQISAVTGKTVLIAIISVAFCTNLHSQLSTLSEKTDLLNQERKKVKTYSNSQLKLSKFFVNGILYTQTYPPTAHPFFESNKWEDGSVLYGDQLIDVRGIRYDILNDQLVYLNIRTEDSHHVILSPVFCKEFYINKHHFRYITKNPDGNSASSVKTGYYEVIYDGKTKFYVKWEKYSKLNHVDAKQVMDIYYSLYLYHNGSYTKIKSKRKLFKKLKDREKELKAFVEQEKLVFTRENYSVAKEILQFYDNKAE